MPEGKKYMYAENAIIFYVRPAWCMSPAIKEGTSFSRPGTTLEENKITVPNL